MPTSLEYLDGSNLVLVGYNTIDRICLRPFNTPIDLSHDNTKAIGIFSKFLKLFLSEKSTTGFLFSYTIIFPPPIGLLLLEALELEYKDIIIVDPLNETASSGRISYINPLVAGFIKSKLNTENPDHIDIYNIFYDIH